MQSPFDTPFCPLGSIRFVVRDDDDRVFVGMEPESVAMSPNGTCYVRRSMWPAMEAALKELPRPE